MVHHEHINNKFNTKSGYTFSSLSDKLGIEGVVVFDEIGNSQAIYGKGMAVSPNKHIVTISGKVYFVEAENEK